ncbi:hypothetical protein J1N35_001543 [Gossypium stocksii]|uniref:Uncharacterized protein n=1 Tax=Gossypium stocksii TaxID=47602 RepID=A0A9D3WJ74_9ROSI|nr:hypothetical protein J1N35_001543 [Gossypium stocksii]
MLNVDPDTAHALEFLEYEDILPTYWLMPSLETKDLFVGQRFQKPYTCMFARMTQDHLKLDVKTIRNCIMLMVKDMSTIVVSVIIADMQARFQYRVSYNKSWWAKQMGWNNCMVIRCVDAPHN